jgi:hypothetical protein
MFFSCVKTKRDDLKAEQLLGTRKGDGRRMKRGQKRKWT